MKPLWNAPPRRVLLSKNNVQVWRAVLDLPSSSVEEFKESLSIDERIGSEYFRFEHDRSRFIVARGILRLILSSYLTVEPRAIRFRYERNGKPRLHDGFVKTNLQFNLSHSEGLALYVFSRDHEVGVDVEYMREISEMEQIVERFFSVGERVLFGALPTGEKQETFFNWWTRKEATIKAVGQGLSYLSNRLDVSAAENKLVELFRTVGDAKELSTWSISNVRPAEGFTGAFAVEGGGRDIQYWQWSG